MKDGEFAISGLVPPLEVAGSMLAALPEWRPVPQPAWRAFPHHTLSKPAAVPLWLPVTVAPLFWSERRSHFEPGSTPHEAIKSLFPADLFPTGMPRQGDRFDRFTENEQLRAYALAALMQGNLLTMVTIRLEPGESVERVIKSWNQYRKRYGLGALSYFGVTVFAPHMHAHLLMPLADKDTAEAEVDYEFVCRRSSASKRQIWGRDLGPENPSVKIYFGRVRWKRSYRGLPGALKYLDENIAEGAGDAGQIPLIQASRDLRKLARGIALRHDVVRKREEAAEPAIGSINESPVNRAVRLFDQDANELKAWVERETRRWLKTPTDYHQRSHEDVVRDVMKQWRALRGLSATQLM
jgi:hypothetical protein